MTKDAAIQKKYFDYNALPDKATRATLRQEAAAIKLAVKRTHDNVIEIGNRLIHAKEVAGHDNFMKWTEAEFGMGHTMAWNFMRAAETFSKFSFSENLSLSQTAIFALSSPSVSDETREVAVELAQSGDLKTVADARQVIEAAKPPKPAPQDHKPAAPETPPEPQTDDDIEEYPSKEPEIDGYGRPVTVASNLGSGAVEVVNADLPEEPEPEQKPGRMPKAVEDALNDVEWLSTLPLFQKLQAEKLPTNQLENAALLWRRLQKSTNLVRREVNTSTDLRGADVYTKRVAAYLSVPHPSQWQFVRDKDGGFMV